MLLISFWQVLMFLIAFWSLKQTKNEGKLGIVHGKARLKLNYMKNSIFGELQSLCQINQVCKEENQRRNQHWRISQPFAKFSQAKRNFRNSFSALQNFRNLISDLRNLLLIFRYFCTDSVRFLPQHILCNYLFFPCNHLKIFLDI